MYFVLLWAVFETDAPLKQVTARSKVHYYICATNTTSPKFQSVLLYDPAISKIFTLFHLPIGHFDHSVKYQSFFLQYINLKFIRNWINLNFQDVSFVWTVIWNTHKKFDCVRIITVEGVAFWKPSFRQNCMCTEWPQMTLKPIKSKVTYICSTSTLESQLSSLPFDLRWTVSI